MKGSIQTKQKRGIASGLFVTLAIFRLITGLVIGIGGVATGVIAFVNWRNRFDPSFALAALSLVVSGFLMLTYSADRLVWRNSINRLLTRIEESNHTLSTVISTDSSQILARVRDLDYRLSEVKRTQQLATEELHAQIEAASTQSKQITPETPST